MQSTSIPVEPDHSVTHTVVQRIKNMLQIAALSKPVAHLIMTDKVQAQTKLLMGPQAKLPYKTKSDSFFKRFQVLRD